MFKEEISTISATMPDRPYRREVSAGKETAASLEKNGWRTSQKSAKFLRGIRHVTFGKKLS